MHKQVKSQGVNVYKGEGFEHSDLEAVVSIVVVDEARLAEEVGILGNLERKIYNAKPQF